MPGAFAARVFGSMVISSAMGCDLGEIRDQGHQQFDATLFCNFIVDYLLLAAEDSRLGVP